MVFTTLFYLLPCNETPFYRNLEVCFHVALYTLQPRTYAVSLVGVYGLSKSQINGQRPQRLHLHVDTVAVADAVEHWGKHRVWYIVLIEVESIGKFTSIEKYVMEFDCQIVPVGIVSNILNESDSVCNTARGALAKLTSAIVLRLSCLIL